MKHGKKALALALVLLMVISLTACAPRSGGRETPGPSLQPPSSPSPSPTEALPDLSGLELEEEPGPADDAPEESTPSGFDKDACFTFAISGVEFSIPDYYEKDDGQSTEEQTYFSSNKGDFVMLIFTKGNTKENWTKAEFEQFKGQMKDKVASDMFNETLDDQSISYEDISLAGLPGAAISGTGKADNVSATVHIACAYHADKNEILAIMFIQGGTPQYDYVSDYTQIIASAQLLDSDDPAETSAPLSGIRPEFKEALDSYEAFMDEYVAFMKRYQDSDGSLSMLTDYLDYLSRYADMMEEFGELGDGDLTTEETLYYLEVSNRITKKLLEAAG